MRAMPRSWWHTRTTERMKACCVRRCQQAVMMLFVSTEGKQADAEQNSACGAAAIAAANFELDGVDHRVTGGDMLGGR